MNNRKLIIRIITLLLAVLLLGNSVLAADSSDIQEPAEVIAKLTVYLKESIGMKAEDMLLGNVEALGIGSSIGDWYAYSMSRLGAEEDYENYLDAIYGYVTDSYQEDTKLDNSKATEWHRISMAVLAAGGDPTDVEGIDLIADGTYNWTQTEKLNTQGVNGFSFALLTLDTYGYAVPDDALYTREDMIRGILMHQRADGGFSLSTDEADIDMTSMMIYALSTYYNSSTVYEYTNVYTGKEEAKTVRQVVDEAVEAMADIQSEDGLFVAWGTDSCESVAQVILALCSIGVDPRTDERFTKNGESLYETLLRYQHESGGFLHVIGDEDPDYHACSQTLNALVAIARLDGGYRKFYDLRPEQDEALSQSIQSLRESIDALSTDAKEAEVSALFEEYLQIPDGEKMYVYNFYKLSDKMEELGIENTAPGLEKVMDQNESGTYERVTVLELPEVESSGGSGTLKTVLKIGSAAVVAAVIVIVISIVSNKKKAAGKGK